MLIILILGLLGCAKESGSSAVTQLFVQKGKDLTLNIMNAEALQDFVFIGWNFNKNDVVVRFIPARKPSVAHLYTGRLEFPATKYSVKLKNLQEADSGLYFAEGLWTQKHQTLAEYYVTVQDPVSPVKLSVDSVSNSSDSCSVTVSCSTQDSNISSTFTFDSNTCSQEGGERSEATSSGASLSVYLVNDSITCYHSNQVSWTKDVTRIHHFCPQRAGSQCVSAGISVCLVKTVVLSVGLIIMVSAVISVHVRERLKKQK